MNSIFLLIFLCQWGFIIFIANHTSKWKENWHEVFILQKLAQSWKKFP